VIKTREKLSYGFGQWGIGLFWAVSAMYTTLYLTDVVYINPATAGLIVLIPNILDIITDFIFVGFADNHSTKYGRYRPWILAGIPCAIVEFLFFTTPGFITNEGSLLIWIFCMCMLGTPLFSTMYSCSFLTLSAVISPDKNDRVSLVTYNNIFVQLANIIVIGTMMPLLEHFGSIELGYRDPLAWKKVISFYCLIAVFGSVVCFFGVKERVGLNEDSNEDKDDKIAFKESFKIVLSTKICLNSILLSSVSMFVLYLYTTLMSYLCIYKFGHEEWITSISLIGIATNFVMVVLCPVVQKRFKIKQIISFCSIMSVVSGIYFLFVDSFWSFVIFVVLKNIAIVWVCMFSEVYTSFSVDYIKRTTGKNVPGLIKGTLSAIQKITSSGGIYFASLLLAIGKYDATKLVQETRTLNTMSYGLAGAFILGGVIIYFLNRNTNELSDC